MFNHIQLFSQTREFILFSHVKPNPISLYSDAREIYYATVEIGLILPIFEYFAKTLKES